MRVKTDKRIVYPAAFIVMVMISIGYNTLCKGRIGSAGSSGIVINREDGSDSTTEGASEDADVTEETRGSIRVYICGSVNNPGVYELRTGDLLYDAVTMAGGMTGDAASEKVNLVYVLESNISVYIPSIHDEEGTQTAAGGIYEVVDIGISPGDDVPAEGLSGEAHGGLININTAGREELMLLPGIGEVTAQSIIDYRADNPFGDIRELMNVSGIGEGRFSRISGLICVG